jgi:hypothetical protein
MKLAIALVLIGLALTGCAGQASPVSRATAASPVAGAPPTPAATTPTPAATPPAVGTVTTADLDALARRVFPGAHPAGCGPIDSCPVTDRLRARVAELGRPGPNEPGPVVQFCRCQNGAEGMRVTSEVTGPGGIAHVVLVYGAGTNVALDLIVVQSPGGQLLLDDTRCTGRGPSTSIYAPTLAACSAT